MDLKTNAKTFSHGLRIFLILKKNMNAPLGVSSGISGRKNFLNFEFCNKL